MVNQISDLLDQWEKSTQIKMVFISGSGEKAFCAGGDLKERNKMTSEKWFIQHKLYPN